MDTIRGLTTVMILVFIGFLMAMNIILTDHWSMLFNGVALALAVTWVAFKYLQELSQKYTDHQKNKHPELTRQKQQADTTNGEGHHVEITTYKPASLNMSGHELYDAAIEKEKAGYVYDAIKLYSQLIEEYPGTQEAEMAMSARDNIKAVSKIQKEPKEVHNPFANAAYYLVAFNLACILIFFIRQVLLPVLLYLFGHPDYYGTAALLSILLAAVLYAMLLDPHIQGIKKIGGGGGLLIIVVLFFVTPVIAFYTLYSLYGNL